VRAHSTDRRWRRLREQPGALNVEMSADPEHSQQRRHLVPRSLLGALYSPNSYGLVLLLIIITYAVSATVTASWAASLVVCVQIATVWVALRASHARPRFRRVTGVILLLCAIAAVVNLVEGRAIARGALMATISGLLYLAAPFSIVRHLVSRRIVDRETVLGAIATYLMVGMFFAFTYLATGALQSSGFFEGSGDGKFPQYLFFSFTTLTTTGYGNLVPAGNPGQSFAVLEMLTGQLFLVTAVAKAVSSWQPGQRGPGLRESNSGG
jgi:Ion channel